MYDEEFQWLLQRAERRAPINPRLFKEQFPDFEYVLTKERLDDLFEEFREERAYIAVSAGIDSVIDGLEKENALEKAGQLTEILGSVVRQHTPTSEVEVLSDWRAHYEKMKTRAQLAQSGETFGINTGLANLDYHLGGLQPGTTYTILGRPGDGKSIFLANFAVQAVLEGCRVGFFSPEMNEWQHQCRIHTLLSAIPEIQAACGLKTAFKNRDLRDGKNFNIKSYRRFLEYVESELPGAIYLFTQEYRREKMGASFIEGKVDRLKLDLLIIDPIYKLKYPRRRESKREELQDIVDSLQDLSMSYNIPVVISNQANRALMGRKGEPPTKDSSFGSDAPVQESDVVMGLKYFQEDRLLKVRCDKNRHGEAFKCEIALWPNIGRIVDITPVKGDDDNFNGYSREAVSELTEMLEKEDSNV